MRKSLTLFAILLVGFFGGKFAKADSCNGVPAGSNLVQNCAFGTGDFTDWTGSTVTDPYNALEYANGVDTGDPLAIGTTPYGGNEFEAFLGSEGYTDTLTQTLSTVAGAQYTIEFALLNDTDPLSPYGNSFNATFGSDTLLSETGTPADAYTLYTYIVDATGSSTNLSFTTENDEGYFELDSISVVPTPEPGSLVLLGTGILGLAGAARRRFNA